MDGCEILRIDGAAGWFYHFQDGQILIREKMSWTYFSIKVCQIMSPGGSIILQAETIEVGEVVNLRLRFFAKTSFYWTP